MQTEQSPHSQPSSAEHATHSAATKFKLKSWLTEGTRSQRLEHLSYAIIVGSAALVGIGIGLGSFVKYIVYLGSIGAFGVLVGIALFIASQLMEEKAS